MEQRYLAVLAVHRDGGSHHPVRMRGVWDYPQKESGIDQSRLSAGIAIVVTSAVRPPALTCTRSVYGKGPPPGAPVTYETSDRAGTIT